MSEPTTTTLWIDRGKSTTTLWIDRGESTMGITMTLIPDEVFEEFCLNFELFKELIRGEPSDTATDWMRVHMPDIKMHTNDIREAFHLRFSDKACVCIEFDDDDGDSVDYAIVVRHTIFTTSE